MINSEGLILRETTFAPLTNKNDFIDNSEFDGNWINVYKDFLALSATNGVAAYNAGTTYDDTLVQFASFGGRTWQWINASSGSGVTPVEGASWTEIYPTLLGHRKNSDTILDEGGANEITAAAIVAGLAVADASTDLSITSHTAFNFLLNSSTGDNQLIPQATQLLSGLISAAEKIKLDQLSGENSGDQTLNSLQAESFLNKATDFVVLNDVLYPTVQAVETRVATVEGNTLPLNLTGDLIWNLDGNNLNINTGTLEINSAYTMPTADGTPNQVMKTDGAGNVTFSSDASVNLGNSDLSQSGAGSKTYTLFGNLVTDQLIFEKLNGNELIYIDGAGNMRMGQNASTKPYIKFNEVGNTTIINAGTNSQIQMYGTGAALNLFSMNNGFDAVVGTGKLARMRNPDGGNLVVKHGGAHQATAQDTHGVGADKFWATSNGTAPTTDYADKHVYYSADVVAGNAAPHFRTELGDIIKLFKGAALTGIDATATDGTIGTNDTITNNIRTRLNELEAIIQGLGMVA